MTSIRSESQPDRALLFARRRRGTVLLLGAVLVVLLVDRLVGFVWLPLVTGLVYLAAAAVGGRDGDLWGPAMVVTGWGVGVLLVLEGPVDGRLFASVVLVSIGAGALVATLLPRAGIPVRPESVAAAVLLSGVLFLMSEVWLLFRSPWVYGTLLALWGLWELRPQRR